MRLTDPETVVPGLREARENERFARQAAFAGLSLPILGLECVQLTPRHRLELEMVGNAFSVGRAAQRADVFQFLWRMNPAWRRGQPITIAATFAWWRIHRVIYRTELDELESAILGYFAQMLQDMPERKERDNGHQTHATHYVTWIASEADFFMRTWGMTYETYRHTPYLILQQLFRAYRESTDEDAQFINASDRIFCRWTRENCRQPRTE